MESLRIRIPPVYPYNCKNMSYIEYKKTKQIFLDRVLFLRNNLNYRSLFEHTKRSYLELPLQWKLEGAKQTLLLLAYQEVCPELYDEVNEALFDKYSEELLLELSKDELLEDGGCSLK